MLAEENFIKVIDRRKINKVERNKNIIKELIRYDT